MSHNIYISFAINLTRYVSPPEACWKIFAFPMHARAPELNVCISNLKINKLFTGKILNKLVQYYLKKQSKNPCLQLGWILTKDILRVEILLMPNICPYSCMLHAEDAGNQENKDIQLAGSYGYPLQLEIFSTWEWCYLLLKGLNLTKTLEQ